MAIFNCFTTPIDSLLGLSPAAVLGILALLLVVTSHVRSYLRLRHVPGPPGAALSKWWMLRNTVGGTMHIALKDACDRYGKLRE